MTPASAVPNRPWRELLEGRLGSQRDHGGRDFGCGGSRFPYRWQASIRWPSDGFGERATDTECRASGLEVSYHKLSASGRAGATQDGRGP